MLTGLVYDPVWTCAFMWATMASVRSLIELCTKTVDKFSNLFKSVGNLNTYSKICDETMTLDSGCSLQLVSIFHWCLSSEFQKNQEQLSKLLVLG
ncbi:hypothetical protein P5673_018216 [Acropora cervicornis]|uniref:Uncharacterized protein n=1 Tax=Acropora cervicornis TaxID=6130 RepID=A0AAD9V2Q4_ACRCE|nr:hypothetical protein P5673_018216 [Acropora cervicornis]